MFADTIANTNVAITTSLRLSDQSRGRERDSAIATESTPPPTAIRIPVRQINEVAARDLKSCENLASIGILPIVAGSIPSKRAPRIRYGLKGCIVQKAVGTSGPKQLVTK